MGQGARRRLSRPVAGKSRRAAGEPGSGEQQQQRRCGLRQGWAVICEQNGRQRHNALKRQPCQRRKSKALPHGAEHGGKRMLFPSSSRSRA